MLQASPSPIELCKRVQMGDQLLVSGHLDFWYKVCQVFEHMIVRLLLCNNKLLCFSLYRTSMAKSRLKYEIKRYVVIVAVYAKNNDVEIERLFGTCQVIFAQISEGVGRLQRECVACIEAEHIIHSVWTVIRHRLHKFIGFRNVLEGQCQRCLGV